jgi:hypothetical protein
MSPAPLWVPFGRRAALLIIAIASISPFAIADGLWISAQERVRMNEGAPQPILSEDALRARDEAHARAYSPLSDTYARLDRARGAPKMPSRWDADVLLSDEDSLASNAELDFNVTNGTYYGYIWNRGYEDWNGSKLFRSNDEGLSWQPLSFIYYRDFSFSDADFVLCDSMAVCVTAGAIEGHHYIFADLCHVRNGAWEDSAPFYSSVTDSVYSVAVATDYDNYPTVPYVYVVAHAGDRILFWRSVDYGRTWINETVLNSGDVRYPDIAYGWNTGGKVYVTYGKDLNVQLDRNSLFGLTGSWTLNFASWPLNDGGNMPVVAGIADSIQVVFERLNTGSTWRHIAVRGSTNAGASWYGATLSGGGLEYLYPDITSRGGAFRLTFLEFTETERHVVYKRCRATAGCWWTEPVTVNDHFPYWDTKPFGNPCVEYLPGNRAGIMYTGFYEYRKVWIDYEDSPVVAVDTPSPDRGLARIGAFPNPLRGSTPIPVSLGKPADVRLELHDVGGRVVCRIFEGRLEAGLHELTWPCETIPAGAYFLLLTQGEAVDVRKVILINGD